MLTIDNYFQQTNALDINTLHPTLRESHEWIKDVTNNGSDWTGYRDNKTIKEVVDLHLQQMNEHDKKNTNVLRSQSSVSKQKKSISLKETSSIPNAQPEVQLVARMPEELRFIRRYLNMHNKTHNSIQVLNFINSIQKAIIERRIRKTSQWAEQIAYIQDKLISVYNSMGNSIKTVLKQDTLLKLKECVDSEKLLPSVGLIKRYIGLHRKVGVKDKAVSLLTQIDRAISKGNIGTGDLYFKDIYAVREKLQNFIADKNAESITIEPATLSGLQGIISGLAGCDCDGNSHPLDEKPEIINSVDFVKMKFPTIGFTGKYRDFIGDPSPGFTAMVFSRPKFGKSSLCTDFAGYLARTHGDVLYVGKEEGISGTLQDKMKPVAHPRLTVANSLPIDLHEYQFVIIDSVTSNKLTPDDLRILRKKYPSIGFIFVFQVTKNGKFRGANDFQHDVDIVIELPQIGKAIQYGRFNQGGTMDIFQSAA